MRFDTEKLIMEIDDLEIDVDEVRRGLVNDRNRVTLTEDDIRRSMGQFSIKLEKIVSRLHNVAIEARRQAARG